MKQHTLIDMDEGMTAVLKFIGSEKFYKLAEDLKTPMSGFLFGLAHGLLVAMHESKKFVYNIDNENETNNNKPEINTVLKDIFEAIESLRIDIEAETMYCDPTGELAKRYEKVNDTINECLGIVKRRME